MDEKIRWGIISTARIAEGSVIPAIHSANNSELVAVASRNLEKGKAFASRCGIPKVYGSYEELIADPDIDAIYNPLPNGLHHEWSIRCAEGGKHVLCEKPLAGNAQDAQEMVDAFNECDLLLAEAFMYRFHPQTQTVKQMLEDNAIGKIILMQASFSFVIGEENDVRLDKALDGGSLLDVGCYCLDVTRYLLGEEPVEVKAMANMDDVDETLVGLMRFPSGALAHFDCSFRAHMTQTVEIRGTHGRIFVEKAYVPFRPDPDADVVIRYWSSKPPAEKHNYEEIKVPKPDQYQLMVEDFADAILNNRPPKFSIEDSVAQMRAIDMLYAACE